MRIFCRTPKSLARAVQGYLSRRHDTEDEPSVVKGHILTFMGRAYDMSVLHRVVDMDQATEWIVEDAKHRHGILFGKVRGGVPHPLRGLATPIPMRPPTGPSAERWTT
jgi:hypothetical protein